MGNHLTKDFIQKQKIKLLELKEKIINHSNVIDEIKVDPDQVSEECEFAQFNTSQQLTLGIREKELIKLRDIDLALLKIDKGEYGICEETDEPISLRRLEKIPWAKLSIEAAEELERKQTQKVA